MLPPHRGPPRMLPRSQGTAGPTGATLAGERLPQLLRRPNGCRLVGVPAVALDEREPSVAGVECAGLTAHVVESGETVHPDQPEGRPPPLDWLVAPVGGHPQEVAFAVVPVGGGAPHWSLCRSAHRPQAYARKSPSHSTHGAPAPTWRANVVVCNTGVHEFPEKWRWIEAKCRDRC